MPRVLGYVFNPLSICFCRRARDGALVAMIYEVHNTFGERHAYVIRRSAASRMAPVAATCGKAFYVSPFIEWRRATDFRLRRPGETCSRILIREPTPRAVLDRPLRGGAVPLTDAQPACALPRVIR